MAKSKYLRRNPGSRLSVIPALVLGVLLLSRQTFAGERYVIRDGNRAFTYESRAADPEQVLLEAGVKLREQDTVTAEAGAQNTTLTVCRSMQIHLDYYGEEMTVDSHGETVRQLLERLNIYPGPQDMLSTGLEQPVYDGMVLGIRQIIREEQCYTAQIPHETIYCYCDTLARGMEQVMTPGRDGEMAAVAAVTYVNGKEIHREILSQTVCVNPVTEIVALGTGLRADGIVREGKLVITEDTITLPTGEVLTYSGTMQVRASGYTHTDAGCDMITSTGTTVHIGTVAVDPRYIPYGTRMFIVSNDGSYIYGISAAEDCGGAIKGDRVDLYFPTTAECFQFGRRDCTVYFLG